MCRICMIVSQCRTYASSMGRLSVTGSLGGAGAGDILPSYDASIRRMGTSSCNGWWQVVLAPRRARAEHLPNMGATVLI